MNISLIESVYNFDPRLKITPRGPMQDLKPLPCVVSSVLVVFTDLNGFEGLFKNLCFSFIADFLLFCRIPSGFKNPTTWAKMRPQLCKVCLRLVGVE